VEVWRPKSSIKKCYRQDLDNFDRLYQKILQEQVQMFQQQENYELEAQDHGDIPTHTVDNDDDIPEIYCMIYKRNLWKV